MRFSILQSWHRIVFACLPICCQSNVLWSWSNSSLVYMPWPLLCQGLMGRAPCSARSLCQSSSCPNHPGTSHLHSPNSALPMYSFLLLSSQAKRLLDSAFPVYSLASCPAQVYRPGQAFFVFCFPSVQRPIHYKISSQLKYPLVGEVASQAWLANPPGLVYLQGCTLLLGSRGWVPDKLAARSSPPAGGCCLVMFGWAPQARHHRFRPCSQVYSQTVRCQDTARNYQRANYLRICSCKCFDRPQEVVNGFSSTRSWHLLEWVSPAEPFLRK